MWVQPYEIANIELTLAVNLEISLGSIYLFPFHRPGKNVVISTRPNFIHLLYGRPGNKILTCLILRYTSIFLEFMMP
jgi:hypothetical protein